jgi:hypothetical protein
MPNPLLSTPVEIQQPIEHISTFLEATVFADGLSVPTSFPDAPDFEQKILSEIQVLANYIKGVTDTKGVTDIKEHLRDLLRIDENPQSFNCKISPLAIILSLDGFSYARFTEKWHSRRLCPVSNASVGTTLALDQIPKDLRGRIVVLNEGNGDTGLRSKEEIKLTERHELLHVIFNEFFARSEFITTPELTRRLEERAGIFDFQFYQELAHSLHDSMFDRARSEIISYCACGDLRADPYKVDAHFWFDHIPAVVEYLNSQSFTEQQGDAILKLFNRSYEDYWKGVDRYMNIALSLAGKNNGLSAESIAYLLVLDRHKLSCNQLSLAS